MSAGTSNTYLKQIKASPAERINGKVKLPPKSEANGSLSANAPNGTTGKGPNGQQAEGMSPEQRKRVSGRPQMTTEEQKIALRKRVCSDFPSWLTRKQVEQFIPTINGIFVSLVLLTV